MEAPAAMGGSVGGGATGIHGLEEQGVGQMRVMWQMLYTASSSEMWKYQPLTSTTSGGSGGTTTDTKNYYSTGSTACRYDKGTNNTNIGQTTSLSSNGDAGEVGVAT